MKTNTILALAGAAAIVLGSFLPWASYGGQESASAWDNGGTTIKIVLAIAVIGAVLTYLKQNVWGSVALVAASAIFLAQIVDLFQTDGLSIALGGILTGLGSLVAIWAASQQIQAK